ncbi:GAF and ANTAR domain-containing protein [Actinomycetospora straminea]|uniref:GAF domain-containing protein n=1 Tax=Actinomycetospora straminea TaxID=663607 RepID=A0ABP9EPJ1_9PSEU|nr:GAF and ANTAR domain-containing protein [Actinomycetospora straminea]MDD7935468.1 GAF and ANTAR domain-containing protein [Actinomycetospora straminea]
MGDLRTFERELAVVVTQGGTDGPQRIVELCVARLPVSGGGITLMAGPDRQQPLWASDEVAARIDELQFRLGEGPCVDAFVTQHVVLVADVADARDDRWPAFAAAARDTSARALMALPLRAQQERIGVIDFYRDRPGFLEADDMAAVRRAADATFWALIGLHDGGRGREDDAPPDGDDDPARWLPEAPLEHVEVHQATGMIVAQLDVPVDAALARLRGHAFLHDRPLADVARDVVARRLRFSEEGN